jgi:hypothetical protein
VAKRIPDGVFCNRFGVLMGAVLSHLRKGILDILRYAYLGKNTVELPLAGDMVPRW